MKLLFKKKVNQADNDCNKIVSFTHTHTDNRSHPLFNLLINFHLISNFSELLLTYISQYILLYLISVIFFYIIIFFLLIRPKVFQSMIYKAPLSDIKKGLCTIHCIVHSM